MHVSSTNWSFCAVDKQSCFEHVSHYHAPQFHGNARKGEIVAEMIKLRQRNMSFVGHLRLLCISTPFISVMALVAHAKSDCRSVDLDYYWLTRDDLSNMNRSQVQTHYCDYGQFEDYPLLPPRGTQLSPKNSETARVIMLAHTLGGGIMTYIHERANELVKGGHEVLVVECAYREAAELHGCKTSVHNGKSSMIYHKFTIMRTYDDVVSFFDLLEADMVSINFLHYSKNMMDYFSKENVPFMYTLHDHHVIASKWIDDMSLTCKETESKYTVPGYIKKRQNAVIERYASVLRRAMFLSTPSYSNKMLFEDIWPQFHVMFIPNRDQDETVASFDHGEVASWREDIDKSFRVLVMGAVGISKGSRIMQNISIIAQNAKLPFEVHLIGEAHWDDRLPNRVVQHGTYKSEEELQSLARNIKPHVVWFPALRHESYCYVLDSAFYLGLPIIASTAGSFAERLVCEKNAWVFDMCMSTEEWFARIQRVRAELIAGRDSSTISERCQEYPKPSFKSPKALFDHSLRILTKDTTIKPMNYEEPWLQVLALNPKLVLENGIIDENGTLAYLRSHKLSRTSKDLAFDPSFYQDRQQLHHITSSKELFAHYLGSKDKAQKNILHEVSPATLYMAYRIIRESVRGCTTKAVYESSNVNAAVLVDPRPTDLLFHVTLNFICKLGPGWNFYIFTNDVDGAVARRFQEAGQDVRVKRFPTKKLIPSAYKISRILLERRFWNSFSEESVMIYQQDAFLLREGASDVLKQNYAFIGAYSEGNGHNSTSPGKRGVNGGLSIRKRSAMLECIDKIEPLKVNAYREEHGMHAFFHNPENNEYFLEDIYFYHCAEMLRMKMPTSREQAHFAVQEFFHDETLSIHGYDKGWYLTTAQYQILYDVMKNVERKKTRSERLLRPIHSTSPRREEMKGHASSRRRREISL